MKVQQNQIIYESYDEKEWMKIHFDNQSGGFLVAHIKHGRYEIAQNKAISLRLVAMGKTVELLPITVDMYSADANIDGEIWELKEVVGSVSSVQNRLRKGKRQARNVLLVIKSDDFIAVDILRGIMSSINFDAANRINKVGILFPNNELVELTKQDIQRRYFDEFFNALTK